MTEIERRSTTQVAGVAAMNVNVLPLVVALVPDACLLRLVSVSVALSGGEKREKETRFINEELTLHKKLFIGIQKAFCI